jgi:two-component system LytT family response regulator
MKLSAIIVDDEPSNREILAFLLKENCPEVTLVGSAESVAAGAELIRSQDPDLVFLDIEMPTGNGFTLVEQFPNARFKVIFTTAYDHYAIRAIRYSALDYLLKPIDPDELREAVTKGLADSGKQNQQQSLQVLLENLKSSHQQVPNKLIVSDKEGIEVLHIPDLIRCEADGNYTSFVTRDKRNIISSKPLGYYEGLLEKHNFLRIHQSTMVNLDFVTRYVRGRGGYVVMQDGKELEVSRTKKEELLARLGAS